MDAYTFFTFLIALSAASAGVVHPSSVIIQGPSRKTTVAGPDGSVIHGVAPGGQIITDEHPGVVAHAAPAPQIIAAVLVEPTVHAVPVPQIHAAPILAAHGHALVNGAHGGLEGHYVHDHSEAFYDDGSYKPHLY